MPKKFEITENIDFRFQEKRILVNTYADGISFLGAAACIEYLYEAAESASIDADIADYMAVLKGYLKQKCGYDPDYLNRMTKKHRNRLSNHKIKREICSVSRSFLEKIRQTERFIYHLIVLQNNGLNIDRAIPFLNKLINSWASLQRDYSHSRQQVFEIIDNKEIVEN